MSQSKEILRHLRVHGSITPLEALQEYGCMRLAARVMELKAMGESIRTLDERHDGGTHAKYVLDQADLFA